MSVPFRKIDFEAGELVTVDGIYDVPEEIYHTGPTESDSISVSGAKLITGKSPYHYWCEHLDPDREKDEKKSPALKLGTAAHMSLLEPERFKSYYHVTPEKFARHHSTKWADEIAELEAAEALGRIALSYADHQKILGFQKGLARHKDVLSRFMAAPKEQSAFWKDKTFGVWRRARFDFFPANGGRIFMDYKTISPQSGGMTDKAISKAMGNYAYNQQAAWYLDAVKALGLCDHPEPIFMFLFQEATYPFEVVLRQIDPEDIKVGRMKNAKALDLFAQSVDTGEWPSYDVAPKVLQLPSWDRMQAEQASEDGAFELTYKLQQKYYFEGCEDTNDNTTEGN